MTTAERRAAILQQLAHAGAPIAARTLATHYGVSRQVIVQDLAVIRASHPGIISTARGYVLEQPDQPAGCTREFKVRHTPERTGQELNLIVDCGGQVKNISISHRVYGRITAEMDIRSRQDVREFLQSFEDSSSTVLSTATDGRVEALEFNVAPGLPFIGVPLKDLTLRKGLLVAGIVRWPNTPPNAAK